MTRLLRRAALLTVALGAVSAAPAAAQAPPVPDERAAAREFSFAAYRVRVALKGQRAALRATLEASIDALDDPRCERAVRAVPGRAEERVGESLVVMLTLPLFTGIRPQLAQFVSELDRVPTADPALRSGRAAWRATSQFFARLPVIPDVCGALDAWRRARFAPGAAPVSLSLFETHTLDTVERRLAAAAARMRALGVSAGAARRFAGDNLLDGVIDDDLLG